MPEIMKINDHLFRARVIKIYESTFKSQGTCFLSLEAISPIEHLPMKNYTL